MESFNDPLSVDPSLDPGRWITCRLDGAGGEKEEAIFRTFVAAKLGKAGNKHRGHYVLLVWSMSGASDLQISLCNQSGSLNLSRECT